MSDELEFGSAATDTEFVSKMSALHERLKEVDGHVTDVMALRIDDDASRLDRDLFALFAINSLCWLNLRLQGIDPAAHPVKRHLHKVRQLMQDKREIVDRRHRPTLDKKVAARFIRNGLWQPNLYPNKKIKFDVE